MNVGQTEFALTRRALATQPWLKDVVDELKPAAAEGGGWYCCFDGPSREPLVEVATDSGNCWPRAKHRAAASEPISADPNLACCCLVIPNDQLNVV